MSLDNLPTEREFHLLRAGRFLTGSQVFLYVIASLFLAEPLMIKGGSSGNVMLGMVCS